MPLFTGVVPPVVTPLNADFTVDYASFTRVLENMIGAGVHGLFVLGSTSEVVFHEGNYTDYEEDRKKRKGDTEPTRIKYKKLA